MPAPALCRVSGSDFITPFLGIHKFGRPFTSAALTSNAPAYPETKVSEPTALNKFPDVNKPTPPVTDSSSYSTSAITTSPTAGSLCHNQVVVPLVTVSPWFVGAVGIEAADVPSEIHVRTPNGDAVNLAWSPNLYPVDVTKLLSHLPYCVGKGAPESLEPIRIDTLDLSEPAATIVNLLPAEVFATDVPSGVTGAIVTLLKLPALTAIVQESAPPVTVTPAPA